MHDQHPRMNHGFDCDKITVYAESAREVRRLSRLITQWLCEQNSSLTQTASSLSNKPISTYDFGTGLVLKTSLLVSYSASPLEPITIDHDGTVCNAAFTIVYKRNAPE